MISYLSLGTNLGSRRENLDRAVRLIGKRAGRIVKLSSVIETAPAGFASENKFLNACVAVDTELSAEELLRVTQEIEREMGRREKSSGGKYSDRIIDIDILLFGDAVVRTENLTIPHPRMKERDFVMTPLKEILP